MTEEQPLTIDEKEAVFKYLSESPSAPMPEEKHNVHTFLFRVATADDTTKVGFLTKEELGNALHTVRTYKDVGHIANHIVGSPFLAAYFNGKSEIVTSTSLSREGFLPKLAVTQTRNVADITKIKKQNSGWFKKEKKDEDEGMQT